MGAELSQSVHNALAASAQAALMVAEAYGQQLRAQAAELAQLADALGKSEARSAELAQKYTAASEQLETERAVRDVLMKPLRDALSPSEDVPEIELVMFAAQKLRGTTEPKPRRASQAPPEGQSSR